jgi:hypothetical protein
MVKWVEYFSQPYRNLVLRIETTFAIIGETLEVINVFRVFDFLCSNAILPRAKG